MTRWRNAVATAMTAAVLLAGQIDAAQASPATSATATSTAGLTRAHALAELGRLAVRPRGSLAGYSRALYGPAWPKIRGCDERNRVLARDLTHVTYRTGGCLVASGTLVSPYTGKVIHFLRGPRTSDAVQIDHVVALADSYMTGAKSWTPAKRKAFANDPAELLAVDAPSNEAKGDDDAASWLPPARTHFDCRYAEIQVSIKTTYHLWVTHAEDLALAKALQSCAGAAAG